MVTSGVTVKLFPLSSVTDSSALEKVFGTFELLEAILKHLPFIYKNPPRRLQSYIDGLWQPDIDGIASYSEPQSLFGIRRVNKMFNNTVEASQMLRRLMFLEPLGESFVYQPVRKSGGRHYGEDEAAQKHYQRSALHWFCDMTSTSVREVNVCPYHFETEPFEVGRAFENWDESKIRKRWDRKEASWRRVRIANYEDSGPISVDVYVKKEVLPKNEHLPMIKLKYAEPRIFDANATVADVYKMALEIDCRGIAEDGQAMAELCHPYMA